MRALLFSLLALSSAAPAAVAQSLQPGIDLGAAAPTGGAGEHRSVGAHVALSLGWGTRDPGLGVRGEVAWTRIEGEPAPAGDPSWRWGDLTARSARATLVYTLSGERARGYGLLGVGAYDLEVAGRSDPDGIVPGLNFGFGVSAPLGRVRLAAELQGVLVISDYGSNEFEPPIYWPLTIGIRL